MTFDQWLKKMIDKRTADGLTVEKKPEIKVSARVWREDKQVWENI